MTALDRRAFLTGLAGGACAATVAAGAAAVGAAVAAPALAADLPTPRPDAVGMLYDTTRCVGCKACVTECAKVNGLEPETGRSGGLWQMPEDLSARTKNVIKLGKDEATGKTSFVKRQCMHCLDPACATGCPFHALTKGEKGIVSWDGSRCIGCRYCEVVCPFNVPKFEWDRFNPKIVKCELCFHLLAEGGQPGCTRVCPTEAVVFGRREDLLAEAKERIRAAPHTYHEDRVYGERDAGGTQVLYLSHVPFETLGLPLVGETPVPKVAAHVHGLVAKFMVLPAAAYVLMLRFVKRHWKEHDEEARRLELEQGLKEQL